MILRAYRKEDSGIIAGWLSTEEEFYKWSADKYAGFPLGEDDIDNNYRPQMKTGRFIPLIALDEENRIIGHFVIRYPDEKDDTSVRFAFVIVKPELRGRGYGKEMLTLGIEYVKDHLSAERIDLGVFAINKNARACYESIGFREYGRHNWQLPVGLWECVDMEVFIK